MLKSKLRKKFLKIRKLKNKKNIQIKFDKVFNIINKLEGFQGSSLKNIDDWWFTVNRLKQLIKEEKIKTTKNTINEIAEKI